MQSNIQSIALKNLRSILIERGISAESLFSKYDSDGDGSISKSEFSNAISSITGQIAPDVIIESVFSLLDKDSSGLLDFHELISLVDSEGESSFEIGENILISEHPLENYNGIYIIQNGDINGKPWYKNDLGSILYFYNANSGGSPSWSLDDRLQDGNNDWYRGGWTRPPNSGSPPLGTRRWVGAGKITIESVSKSNPEDKSSNIDESSNQELAALLSEIDLAMNHFEKRVVDGSLPAEKATEFANSAFENKVKELPIKLQGPARAAWRGKMNTFQSTIGSLLETPEVGLAGLGAAALTGAAITQKSSESIDYSSEDEVENIENTSKIGNYEQPSVPENDEVNSEEKHNDSELSQQEEANLNAPESSISDEEKKDGNPVITDAYNDFISSRMLSERNALKEKYSGKYAQIKITIISIERTFGIGLSENFRGGQTLIANSEEIGEVEIRLPKSYDGESLKPRLELEMNVSIADWNAVRKRLILNNQ